MNTSRDMPYLPVRYAEEEPHWQGLAKGELVLQRCLGCAHIWYPIGPVCPQCLSDEWEWTPLSGRGTVTSYVTFHKAWAPWLKARVPYVVAQVELNEGPRLTTNVLGVDPADVRVGLEVTAAYEEIAPNVTILQFTTDGRP